MACPTDPVDFGTYSRIWWIGERAKS